MDKSECEDVCENCGKTKDKHFQSLYNHNGDSTEKIFCWKEGNDKFTPKKEKGCGKLFQKKKNGYKWICGNNRFGELCPECKEKEMKK